MREIDFSGYIDSESFWGDEVTPEMLREQLYGKKGDNTDDVLIRMNSFGGSCFAATLMHDMIREYPGHVTVTISGVAASAATVVACAGASVAMTPGSLYMIHNPSSYAFGEEKDMDAAKAMLAACKASILNVYKRKCKSEVTELAALMDASTWMDAETALAHGFIDAIVGDESANPTDAASARVMDRAHAEAMFNAYIERQKPHAAAAVQPLHGQGPGIADAAPPPKPAQPGVPKDQLLKRLALLNR